MDSSQRSAAASAANDAEGRAASESGAVPGAGLQPGAAQPEAGLQPKVAKPEMPGAESTKKRMVELGAGAVPAAAWRHFHIITPLTRAGMLWVFLAYMVYNFLSQALQEGHLFEVLQAAGSTASLRVWGIIGGGLLGVTAVVMAFGYLSWRRRVFALVESGIHFRQGILLRSHTQMRWDRVQSVEIQQSLFGRIFGFGTVKIESAGNDDDLQLGLLRVRDAAALRREILSMVDYVRSEDSHRALNSANSAAARVLPALPGENTAGEAGAVSLATPGLIGDEGPSRGGDEELKQELAVTSPRVGECHTSPMLPAPEPIAARAVPYSEATAMLPAPEPIVLDVDDLERDLLIYELPVGRLVAANLISVRFIATVLAVVGGVVTTALAFINKPGITPGLLGPVLVLMGFVWSFVKGLFDDYGTKIYLSENGLRRRSGLTKLTTSTYPPQRVHAVRVHRPWLWKRFDWWKMEISRAGTAGDSSELSRTFIPVATRAQMLQVLWALMPGLGTANDGAVLAEGLDGSGTGEWFTGAPRQARWLDLIGYSGRGVALTPRAMLSRAGKLGRMLGIVFQEHIQSVHISVGPLERRLGLASLTADIVPGIAMLTAGNLAVEKLWELTLEENDLARAARQSGVTESLAQWKERVGIRAQ
ncbi:MAG: PH domain-containing protein [Arcanobacterium sp.]|nr:PH domain-containing protein [Arcanobacterium sp.]